VESLVNASRLGFASAFGTFWSKVLGKERAGVEDDKESCLHSFV